MSVLDFSSKKKLSDVGSYESNLSDVMTNLRRNIGKNLNVASLGRITDVDATNREYVISLFPIFESDVSTNGQEFTVKALSQFWEISESDSKKTVSAKLATDDIVLILFVDLDYKEALNYELNHDVTTSSTYTVADDILTHTKDYGIIIGKVEC